MTRRFITLLILIQLASFGAGYIMGLVTYSDDETEITCSTDTECLEMGGCGGYADPCEETEEEDN